MSDLTFDWLGAVMVVLFLLGLLATTLVALFAWVRKVVAR